MGASTRKSVVAKASDLARMCHIQQETGTPNGSGGLDNPVWTDVPGLSHVPMAFRTWSPYQKFQAQQLYPGVNSRCFMRYRKSVNITTAMRVVYGTKIYMIRGVANYDEANNALELLLEELQATGSGH